MPFKKKFLFLSIFILSAIYLLQRIPFLWEIPLFEDETFHTQWTFEILNKSSGFIKPLSSGIAPFFSYAASFFTILLPNQILAGKTVSLIAGLLLCILLLLFLRKMKIKYSQILSIIFVSLPFTIIYDKLAILDTLLTLLVFASFVSAYYLYEKRTNKRLLLYFFPLTLALFTKQIAALTIPPLVALFIIGKKYSKETFYFVVASLVPLLFLFAALLSFKTVAVGTLSNFVFIPGTPIQAIAHFKENVFLTLNWFKAYFPNLFIIYTLLGMLINLINFKKNIFLTIFFLLYLISLLFFDALLFPRHLLSLTPFLIIFIGLFITTVNKKSSFVALILVLALTAQTLYFSVKLHKDPQKSGVIAKEDSFQFWEDWTSGRNIEEVAVYINKLSVNEKVILWVEPTSTLYRFGLPLYLNNNLELKVADIGQTFKKSGEKSLILVNHGFDFKLEKENIKQEQFFVNSSRHSIKIIEIKQ